MTTDTVSARYADPRDECDLVMKGGVTSGLVYPPAVLELSTRYRIRNIGGTSAGAVAAALTAAAEHGRATGGYERLGQVAAQLRQPGYLRNLFQGSSTTEPLLELVIKAPQHMGELKSVFAEAKGDKIRLAKRLAQWLSRVTLQSGAPPSARAERWGAVAGVVAAFAASALIFGIAALFGNPPLSLFLVLTFVLALVFSAFGSQVASVLSALFGLYGIAFTKVPENLFGICSGLRDRANPRYTQVAATEWLCESIEMISGKRGPGAPQFLTFGELKRARKPITLQFVTTDVSDGRPYVLPFDEPFIFKRAEFLRLFPTEVVDELVTYARTEANITLPNEPGQPPQYLFLPHPDHWPVVVAARLSMSFPMFFSSAPLYQLPQLLHEAVRRRRRALRERKDGAPEAPCPLMLDEKELEAAEDLNRQGDTFVIAGDQLAAHWFSDGGIASNFPIHFFDGWLPARPTFGITLRYTSAELLTGEDGTPQTQRACRAYIATLGERVTATRRLMRGADDVWLPKAQESVAAEWRPIHDPAGVPEPDAAWKFLWAIVTTMQNYRDNMQAALASYRERVVQVRLGPAEGGFNLEMPKRTLDGVVRKGERAGLLLRDFFKLEHHQWVRLRMLISRLERAFEGLDANTPAKAQSLIQSQAEQDDYPFREVDAEWCKNLGKRSDALLQLPDGVWKGSLELFESESSLRVTPHP